jgi:predicted membrane GTPase involved in stress response
MAKLVTPELGPLDDELPPAPRPDLRSGVRRSEPELSALVQPGFVTEAVSSEPTEPTEVLTIEVPRRLKRALLAEVANRKDDPERRTVASMKSVILEALVAHGFGELINRADIEVQAGIFMKRQAAQLRRR